MAREGMYSHKGGPFGCVIVKDGKVVGEGSNEVTSSNDPTAHAEVVAIRKACAALGNYQLTDCDVYASSEPCPMCLGAIYWARPRRVIYANTRQEAATIDFDDELIYQEIGKEGTGRQIPFLHHPHINAQELFREWEGWGGKQEY